VRRLLVCAAVEVEARGLARRLGLSPVPGSPWPRFRHGALEVLCVGLRAARLADRGADAAPALVVSAGTCGALAPDLRTGTLVVPDAVMTPAGDREPTAPLPGLPAAGTLLTVDVPAVAADKARLWLGTGALAVDMESALVLAWARARGVPAAVVRAVADTARAGVPADLASVVDADGAVRTARALRVALARPRAVPEALALRRGTERALDAVAAALATLARAG